MSKKVSNLHRAPINELAVESLKQLRAPYPDDAPGLNIDAELNRLHREIAYAYHHAELAGDLKAVSRCNHGHLQGFPPQLLRVAIRALGIVKATGVDVEDMLRKLIISESLDHNH